MRPCCASWLCRTKRSQHDLELELRNRPVGVSFSGLAAATDQVSDQVSDQVKALLKCLAKQPLTALACMKKLGLNHRPTFRKNYLQPAMEAGLIERTLPDKPNSSRQQYRLVRR